MKSILKGLIALVIVGLFGYTIYYLMGKSETPKQEFKTAILERVNIVQQTVATGAIEPRKKIDITPKVSGIVEEIFFEAGDLIRKGDVLARVRIVPNMLALNNAETRLNRAKLSLADAEKQHSRGKALFDEKVIPASEYEQIQILFQNAQEEVDASKSNLQLIKDDLFSIDSL